MTYDPLLNPGARALVAVLDGDRSPENLRTVATDRFPLRSERDARMVSQQDDETPQDFNWRVHVARKLARRLTPLWGVGEVLGEYWFAGDIFGYRAEFGRGGMTYEAAVEAAAEKERENRDDLRAARADFLAILNG